MYTARTHTNTHVHARTHTTQQKEGHICISMRTHTNVPPGLHGVPGHPAKKIQPQWHVSTGCEFPYRGVWGKTRAGERGGERERESETDNSAAQANTHHIVTLR